MLGSRAGVPRRDIGPDTRPPVGGPSVDGPQPPLKAQMEIRDDALDLLPEGFLPGGRAVHVDLTGADVADVATAGAQFDTCRMVNADLSGSTHDGSAFLNCDLRGANLATATLRGCRMTGSDLTGTTLLGLTVDGGDWSYVNLRLMDLSELTFAGVRLVEADLAEADLTGVDLTGADLTGAMLRRATLRDADLRGATLDGADLSEADLAGATGDLALAVRLAEQRGARIA